MESVRYTYRIQEVIYVNDTTMYIVWAVAIVVFGAIEGVTFQLVSIWFVFGSIAALISAFLGAPIYLQIILWIAVSLAALLLTRPIVRKKLNTKIQPTNLDRCIGEQALVIEDIDNSISSGQVKVDGKIWMARSENGDYISKDSVVTVEKIEGVKLIVSNK